MVTFTQKLLTDMPEEPARMGGGKYKALIERFLSESQPGWGLFVVHPSGAAATVKELLTLRQNLKNAMTKHGAAVRVDYAKHGIWVFRPEHLQQAAAETTPPARPTTTVPPQPAATDEADKLWEQEKVKQRQTVIDNNKPVVYSSETPPQNPAARVADPRARRPQGRPPLASSSRS